jgi:glycosyltransferase involved in cell wall biosynthesis
MPRVTLGMPVYNGERFLEETLRALLAQTYKDFELVISDNASTDATEGICKRHAAADARIRYFREQENHGAAWNYNRVVELATGEYFKWAAHDDLITPDYLEKCVAVLDADPTVVLCCTDDQDIDQNGNEVDARRQSHILSGERGSSPKATVRFRRLIRDDYDCEQVFGLIRTDVLRRTKMILPYTDSDRTLLGELGLHGRLHEIQERLFLHRQHMGSSGKANPIHTGWHARAGWFDPSLQGRVLFSRWRQLREYLIAIFRSPISLTERIACVFWMAAYFRGRVKGLAKEIVMGFRLIWLRLTGA